MAGLFVGPNQMASAVQLSSIIIPSVSVPACPQGFMMGSNAGIYKNEAPVHGVIISHALDAGTTPITNGQFDSVIGSFGANRFALMAPDPKTSYHRLIAIADDKKKLELPSEIAFRALEETLNISIGADEQSRITSMGGLRVFEMERVKQGMMFEGVNKPAVGVRWYVAAAFGDLLSILTGEPGWRLPTEAEWEYMTKGKDQEDYGDDVNAWLSRATAHYNANATLEVGQKKPNSFGLYDMIGNVSELVADWHGEYPSNQVVDPTGPKVGKSKVRRGGYYGDEDYRNLRAAARNLENTSGPLDDVGFRVVRGI